jgi:porin
VDADMRFSILLTLLCVICSPAFSQKDKKTDDLKPADPDTGESTLEERTLGLLPNPFEKHGVKFAITYIGEVLGNPTGGAKQGAVYEDRINFAVDVDLEKLLNLKQVSFHANAFQIDGGGLTRGALLNFLGVSGIEAQPTTRLYEIWLEKKWGEKVALRAGQLAADTEFINSKYTDVSLTHRWAGPRACRSIFRAGDHRRRWPP